MAATDAAEAHHACSLAVVAVHVIRDLYPKNVCSPSAPTWVYQRAFIRKWCGTGGGDSGCHPAALSASFVDTRRLHAAVLTFSDGVVLVAYRGTDGRLQKALNHWIAMQAVELPPLPTHAAADPPAAAEAPPLVRVHAAWWASLQGALPELRERIGEALHAAGRAAPWRPPRVYFAGHSLGGAFAQLSAMLLLHELPVRGVFCFGAPRVGDAAWARHYSSALGAITRAFVNDGDGVPLRPPSLSLLPYQQLPSSCLVGVKTPGGFEGEEGLAWGSSAGGGSSRSVSMSGLSDGGAWPGQRRSSSDEDGREGEESGSGAFLSRGVSYSGGEPAGDAPCVVCGRARSLPVWVHSLLDASVLPMLPRSSSGSSGRGSSGGGGGGLFGMGSGDLDGASACGRCSSPCPLPPEDRTQHNEHKYVAAVVAWGESMALPAAGGDAFAGPARLAA